MLFVLDSASERGMTVTNRLFEIQNNINYFISKKDYSYIELTLKPHNRKTTQPQNPITVKPQTNRKQTANKPQTNRKQKRGANTDVVFAPASTSMPYALFYQLLTAVYDVEPRLQLVDVGYIEADAVNGVNRIYSRAFRRNFYVADA